MTSNYLILVSSFSGEKLVAEEGNGEFFGELSSKVPFGEEAFREIDCFQSHQTLASTGKPLFKIVLHVIYFSSRRRPGVIATAKKVDYSPQNGS